MRRAWIVLVGGLLTLGIVVPALAVDNVADWTLPTADGGTVVFHEQLAKGPVVVSFWATWCKPCLKEMPQLDLLGGEFAGQVTFLAVNADNTKSVAKVPAFLAAKNFQNLLVPLDTGGLVQQQLQAGGTMPFLILFDAQGREVYRHVGYKDGDELELKHEIEMLLNRPAVAQTASPLGKPAWAEAVSATDKFKYSYNTDTEREIFENWLDVAYQFGGFRTGLMLRSEAPNEFGERGNTIEHRFFEFDAGKFSLRAGHFFGIFGRGLVFNSYEDRVVKVDTRLDGLTAVYRDDALTVKIFSGTPSIQPVDIRGADVEYALDYGLKVGASGLTYRPDDYEGPDGGIHREWVTSARLSQNFGPGDYYLEYGQKTGYDFDPLTDEADAGEALYANLNLYQGAFSLSWEHSYYKRFAVVANADGKTTLNRPPSLAREFTWTLLNRAPHNLDPDDERGHNLDLLYSGDNGWTLLASGATLQRHNGDPVYDLAFGSVQKDRLGDFRATGGFGYQDSEGLRQTVVAELTWFATETRSWTLQVEHQHVRLGGGYGYDDGAYDVDWFKLEYETAPRWSFAGVLEMNNKYAEQQDFGEGSGPFPAAQITYTLSRGGNVGLWAGKRQAGYLCSGGVCKLEPAFEGLEVYGLFRY